jgi:glycosyltransferase involved in cell wall biosynthesis
LTEPLRSTVRVHHVIASVLEKHGGPAYSVPALCRGLQLEGQDVTLHTYAPAPVIERCNFRVQTYHHAAFAPRIGLSWDMPRGLRRAARSGEIMHVHGLWRLSNVLPAVVVRGTACRLVMSPRGMLDAWSLAQSARTKRVAWALLQGPAVRRAALLHATSDGEAQGLRQLGLRAPIAVVPNGVDVPDEANLAHFSAGQRKLLFLSRLHPKKGVDVLLRAWARVEARFADWALDIVGPDEQGYLSKLQALAAELGIQRVQFVPPTYGSKKAEHYREAQLYVLPTHSENFGVGIAEALAYGLPVIAGHGAPWSALIRERAGYHVASEVESLSECLEVALGLPPEVLREMGARGREYVVREFAWASVAQALSDCYAWLTRGGSRPPCVQL